MQLDQQLKSEWRAVGAGGVCVCNLFMITATMKAASWTVVEPSLFPDSDSENDDGSRLTSPNEERVNK